MAVRSRVLVLTRRRAGDTDLIAKVYSHSGIADLLVRDALLPDHRFHGVFEPFNTMTLDYRQRGEIILPQDFTDLQPLSLLSRDYDRFLWMSHVCDFILRHVRFYDHRLFENLLAFLKTPPRGRSSILSLLLRLSYIKFAGITPRFLSQKPPRGRARIRLSDGSLTKEGDYEVSAGALRLILTLWQKGDTSRLRASDSLCEEARNLLDALITYHTR